MPIVLYYLKCLCRVETRTQVASAFRRTLMDVHQLELFLAVMDSPSMTKAAEKSHLSPGAVSLQLHNLAEELHAELFVRRGKQLIPTPAAVRLAERAREVVRLMGHIQQEFENDVTKDSRPFHFATGVTTLIYQLGRPLRQLRNRFPHAEIRVTVRVAEDTEGIKRLVESGFGYSILPEHALRGRAHFFEKLRVDGRRLTRKLALAMIQTESPRKLTESIASFLRDALME